MKIFPETTWIATQYNLHSFCNNRVIITSVGQSDDKCEIEIRCALVALGMGKIKSPF